MPQRDTLDFILAFALGVAAGAGTAVLLRPKPPTRAQRVLRQLQPHRKRARKRASHARAGFRDGASASVDVGRALGAAGRELAAELRAELSDFVASAREQLARSVRAELAAARRGVAGPDAAGRE